MNFFNTKMIFLKHFHILKQANSLFISKFKNLHLSAKRKTAINLEYQLYDDDRTKNTVVNPVIISHCLMGQSSDWSSIAKSLLEDLDPPRKIYVVDNRNHGNSPHTPGHSYELMAEDYIQLLKNLELKEAVFLGHSMGGRASMYAALKYVRMYNILYTSSFFKKKPHQ